MIDEVTKKRVMELCNKPAALGGWLGLPYEQNGCLKFVIRVYNEMGIDADENAMKEARNFRKIEEPEFGDIVVWRDSVIFPTGEFHVGMMLDRFKAIQCVEATNGVGKVYVNRYPWDISLKGFYRHKCFCE